MKWTDTTVDGGMPPAPPQRQLTDWQTIATALIEGAAKDLINGDGTSRAKEDTPSIRRYRRRMAKLWFEGAHARITFKRCCDILGLDPDVLRTGIYRATIRQVPIDWGQRQVHKRAISEGAA